MAMVHCIDIEQEPGDDRARLTWTLPDGTVETAALDGKRIAELRKQCRDFRWNRSAAARVEIGAALFALLNGDAGRLVRALREADQHGENLQLLLSVDGPVADLPFELLHEGDFVVPTRGVHIVRQVSDYGSEKTPQAEDHPLRLLFMACSPAGLLPVLHYEEEEETIYRVTADLALDIDVEDTGSVEGLGDKLRHTAYDVVHLSGHADIDAEGKPFFWMEDDEGQPARIGPAALWDKLRRNPPRLLFLSGCRTGEHPGHVAAASFAQQLVASHSSTVLGWGLPVSDAGAARAAEILYQELSRGKDVLAAVLTTRRELFERYRRDWSLLRLFSDGTPLAAPLVREGQKRRPRARDLQYTCLGNSQVKVLKEGFIGRRQPLQQGLRCLRKDEEKVGLLLHGTGGLGKSCLAGKLCDRLHDHTLIVVHGPLSDTTFSAALKDGFLRASDREGLETLAEKVEMPDKIGLLCSSCLRQCPYLILLDDFEQNLEGIEQGSPVVRAESKALVQALLTYLPYAGKMSQLLITSRYEFPFAVDGADLIAQRLEPVGLTSFRGADRRKKTGELTHIETYPDEAIRAQLVEAGRGNPRLMEALDTLVGQAKGLNVPALLAAVKDKQDEFVQELILKRILESQTPTFQRFLRRISVYLLPILERAAALVCEEMDDWRDHLERGVALSLIERDSRQSERVLYWVTPLLREEAFAELPPAEAKTCHEAAVCYYEGVQLEASEYSPLAAMQLVTHALAGGLQDEAIEAAGPLLAYLRTTLAYTEARGIGEGVLSRIAARQTPEYARLLFETGWICKNLADAKKAVEYFEQALAIDKAVYGDKHPSVAAMLNNLGAAWRALGEAKKAVEYYEQALAIVKAVYGDNHPDVAIDLNNLGGAWGDLGEAKKAVDYFEQALAIDKAVYGDKHPKVATRLNNLGSAWSDLGEAKKAVEYFEQAHGIFMAVYGPDHPHTKVVKGWLDGLAGPGKGQGI